jgi:hypothetical protein
MIASICRLLCIAVAILLYLATGAVAQERRQPADLNRNSQPAPITTIENLKSWTEQHGDQTILWTSWTEVTRFPGGSKSGSRTAGIPAPRLAQLRGEFNSIRRNFWKDWAKQIRNEIAVQLPYKAREFDAFRRYLGTDGLVHNNLKHNLQRMDRGLAPIGMDGKSFNLHHRIPLSHGGTNDVSNLTAIPATVHQRLHSALHSGNFSKEAMFSRQVFKH